MKIYGISENESDSIKQMLFPFSRSFQIGFRIKLTSAGNVIIANEKKTHDNVQIGNHRNVQALHLNMNLDDECISHVFIARNC